MPKIKEDEDYNLEYSFYFIELAQNKITPYIGDILIFMRVLEKMGLIEEWFNNQGEHFTSCGCTKNNKPFIHFHLTDEGYDRMRCYDNPIDR